MVAHVGISVTDASAAIAFFSRFGYRVTFNRFRDEPFLGEAVGCIGAAADIYYMERPDSVTIELLEYRQHCIPEPSDGTFPGVLHLAIEVSSIPDDIERIGYASIPDGKNMGDIISYVRGPDGIVVELIIKADR